MKHVIDWSKDLVLVLIDEWKKHPCLYDPTHENYNDKLCRMGALEAIVQALHSRNPIISELDVKAKLGNLRGQYCSELRRIKMKNALYHGSTEIYESPSYWFKPLAFLKPFIGMKKPLKDGPASYYTEVDQEFCENSENSAQTLEFEDFTAKRIKLETLDDMCLESPSTNTSLPLPQPTQHELSNSKDPEIDEQVFGEYVRAETSHIKDELLRLELKHEITNLIYQYRKKDLMKSMGRYSN